MRLASNYSVGDQKNLPLRTMALSRAQQFLCRVVSDSSFGKDLSPALSMQGRPDTQVLMDEASPELAVQEGTLYARS